MIFIEATVFIFLFTLVLECDDNETDEDVDHEECDNDDVDDVIDGDVGPVALDGTHFFRVGVDGGI